MVRECSWRLLTLPRVYQLPEGQPQLTLSAMDSLSVWTLNLLLFSCSLVSNSATLWTTAHWASLSFTISWNLLKLTYTELMMPSNHLIFCWPLFLPSIFPSIRVFPISWLFASGGQNIGASAAVLPMNIQGWSPLELTGLICLQSKGLSRVFSSTADWKYQFFKLYIHGIIFSLGFFCCSLTLLWLIITFMRSIHILVFIVHCHGVHCVQGALLYMDGMYQNVFIHFTVDRCLHCFLFLPIAKKAATNLFAHLLPNIWHLPQNTPLLGLCTELIFCVLSSRDLCSAWAALRPTCPSVALWDYRKLPQLLFLLAQPLLRIWGFALCQELVIVLKQGGAHKISALFSEISSS